MTPREELRRVTDEIRDYPRPVAGCDAQFNHLLERRGELETAILAGKGDEEECS